jgi:molybdopterin molybdotransferase
VALLSTGNELVAPGKAPGPDQIVDSNGVMLRSLVEGAGGDAVDLGIVRDDADAVMAAIESARGADVLVTVGGASVGDHDLVAPALARCGAELDFWKVAIRPGKPVLIGRLGDAHVVGLPGNPVSAFVCAHLFLLPLLRRLRGEKRTLPKLIEARSTVVLPANGTRRDFMRATSEWRHGERWVTPARTQDSSMLAVLAGADALLVRAPNAAPVAAGEQVEIITLDNAEADS